MQPYHEEMLYGSLYSMNIISGLLNPLDAPHHLRADCWNTYREGVVRGAKKTQTGKGSYVDIGLSKVSIISVNMFNKVS